VPNEPHQVAHVLREVPAGRARKWLEKLLSEGDWAASNDTEREEKGPALLSRAKAAGGRQPERV
jgi:hypothetical protein